MNNPLLKTVFSRFLIIVALFVVWIIVIGMRLVYLQVNQSDWLREKAQYQRRDEQKSKILRGSILDRSGRTLAISIKVKSLSADPREIDDLQITAERVGIALKIKPQEILQNLQEAKEKGKKFVWLARKVDEETVQKINESLKDIELRKADEPRFKGLHWREEQKRSYPYGSLAAQVIGFSDLDDVGQAGIELSQEKNLHGASIKTWQDRDRLGRVYDESEVKHESPEDVVLTISHSIQYKVEEALKSGVKAARAKSGIAIVLDPKTGEILAMANYPTFDPNKFSDFPAENFKNKAVQSSYAPGSVFKLVTYGAGLQEKLIKPDEWFSCGNGVIEVGKHEFKDTHCGRAISYTKALAISSNIGAIKTGLKVGEDKFINYIRQFGFGEVTGVELPAETRGQVRPLESWKGDSLASMSIGYEIAVTALQTASAFATVANNGIRVRPHIIKEIRHADGQVISTSEPEQIQVVSPDTAAKLRQMLHEVVLNGTGKRAALGSYTSAGKTGTAWKYDPVLKRVSGSKYVSSFVGMAPVDNPALVIAVVLDEPQGAMRNGGEVSAPIFQEIAEQILPELNIAPDIEIQSDAAQETPLEAEIQTDAVPQILDSKATATENIEINKNIEIKSIKKTDKSSSENQEKKPEKEKAAPSRRSPEIKAETNRPEKESKQLAKPKLPTPALVNEKLKTQTKNKPSMERMRIVP